ncbi:MAG: AraC family transcriptional regulator [Oscillospiraceae bacterium]|nr:AraC family transcriptional regulator [Oscillospiraceae bacterium]
MEQEFSVSRVAFAYYKKYAPGHIFRQADRKYHGLVFVLSGELTLTLESEVICAPAGSILLQRQHDNYRLEATGDRDTEYIVISYLAQPEDVMWTLLPQRCFSTAYPQRYWDLFSAVVELNASYTVCSQTRLRANVQEILCCMIQENYHRTLSLKEGYVEKAVAFMENHFSSPITCDDIAGAAGISASHLRLLFKKRYDISLTQKLNQIRVQRAKELLSSGIFTLAEVANACGFQNEYYFSRVFKQYTGISPGKY